MKTIDIDVDFEGELAEPLAKLYTDFANSIDESVYADIQISKRPSGSIEVFMECWSEGGDEPLVRVARVFYPDEGLVDLDLFAMDESIQGKGIAKRLHSLQLKFMDKFKFTKYSVAANLEVGGYAWLKYGMTPSRPEKLLFTVGQYLKRLEEESPEWYYWKNEYQRFYDAKDKIKYARENLTKLKPALLGGSWGGGLDFKKDPAGRKMLENYIGSTPIKPVKNRSELLVNMQSRRQVYLERFKSQLEKGYEKNLAKLDKELTRIISSVDVDSLNQLTQKEFRSLRAKLRRAQEKAYKIATEELNKELKEFSVLEQELEVENIAIITDGLGARKLVDSWAASFKNPIQATGDLLEPFIQDLTPRNIARVEKQIRISISQGRTISETVRAVRGTKRNNYRDGVLNKNWNDARTVIRTATQHVSSESRKAIWEQNKDIINGYQWVSTIDGDTSKQCRSLDTQVFETNKGPMPPIHPGCRSTTVPYFNDDVDLYDEGATRSAETGPINVNTSYYQWLSKQPVAFQNDTLGPTRGKLLRNGGLSAKEFSELQLNKNFLPLTLDEMRKLKPNAFDKAGI